MLKAKSSSPISNIKWSFFKSPKFWAIVLFFIVLVALPVALYEVQQQQTSQQHAASGCTPYNGTNWCEGNQHYTCDNGGIIVYINPVTNSCSKSTTSFQSAMDISAGGTNKGAYTIHWGWLSNFCTAGGKCDQTNTTNTLTPTSGTLNGSSTTRAQSAKTAPSGQYAGLACGNYQNDFGFYVTRNSDGHQVCGISLGNSLDITNNNATWCSVGTCSLPTPTPTHSPTATPTPTGLPTDTPTPTIPVDTDTPTPTASPSATPTDTPAATPTVTPTGTLTPTVTPTDTPTGNPTATPVPPGSPTPTIIVVKPTLPPTGPSNTIMAIGLVGVAISVLGLALLIGI